MAMKTPRCKLITIDVGNSRIKFGLFDNHDALSETKALPKCCQSMATNLDAPIPWDELADWTRNGHPNIDSVILGGVNPRGRDKILDGWPAIGWPDPFVIDNPFILPITINIASQRTVGVDRLLNAIAANVIRPEGRSMIIIDSGTATTVDIVSNTGTFEGGAILPGFQLGAQALHQYTALLPHITNRELAKKSPAAIGKNTRDAIRSGLFWGQFGGIQELVRRYRTELTDDPVVVVTGGAGRLLVPCMPADVLHEPYLALQGLVIVAHRLRQHKRKG